jgi:hypothetical protein
VSAVIAVGIVLAYLLARFVALSFIAMGEDNE